ncbi:MAG: hypothetical protein ABI550_07065 [Ignavibacteriaceae bacterium]
MCSAYNRRRWFFKGFIFVLVFITLLSFALMFLWNWLMPMIFGLTEINFIQAVGLLILSKIIFSGIGRKRGPHFYGRPQWQKDSGIKRILQMKKIIKPNN